MTSEIVAESQPTPRVGERAAVEPLVLKAAGGTHLVVVVFCFLPFILALAPQVLGGRIVPELLVIGGIVAFLALVWVRSFRIELTPTEFRYRSLFGRSRAIAYDAIASARIQVGVLGPGDRLRPHYRLVITPKDARSTPIVVNLKVFAFEPLKRVCAAVDAELDEGAG